MRFFIKCMVIVGAWMLSAAAMPADGLDTVEIMLIGEHHGDEVPDAVGANWLALIKSSAGYELTRVRPKFTTYFDPVNDDENDKKSYSGKKVEVKGVDPLLLVRARTLKPGPVVEAAVNNEFIDLNGQPYALERKCNKKLNAEHLRECKVYLTHGKARQFIGDATEGDGDFTSSITITWAGDLDHDGKLDLILDFSSYNNGSTVLYLSSGAKQGELTGKVAEFSVQGC